MQNNACVYSLGLVFAWVAWMCEPVSVCISFDLNVLRIDRLHVHV